MLKEEVKGLIMSSLSAYRDDYNKINPGDTIDFNLEIKNMVINPKDIQLSEQTPSDEIESFKNRDPFPCYYLRLAKVFLDREPPEKQLIYSQYKEETIEKKNKAHMKLYRDCMNFI